LNETIPKKRISLSINLDSSPESKAALFSYFLRLPDKLVSSAHFRPEVLRKVRQTREEESRKLRKADEDEKAEERTLKRDKDKKEKREAMLNALSADEQRKFLDREREKDIRKGQKKMTKKG
jgi:septal ring factor EnvC (AmiA/AmiB activator)